MLDALESEGTDELLDREVLRLGAGVPTQQSEIVDQSFWHIPLLAKESEVALGVLALGQLGAVLGKDQRHVRVRLGPLVAQRVDQHQLIWRVGEVLLAADNVRHLHERVIYWSGDVIGRIGVRLDRKS